MATDQSFPKALEMGLKVPLFLFAGGVLLSNVISAVPLIRFAMPLGWWMVIIGVIGELVAVPVALFFLAQGAPFATRRNKLLTIFAAIPLLLALLLLLVLTFGSFHM